MSNQTQQKPNLFKQYLKGLTAYLYFRVLDLAAAIWNSPGRIVRAAKARIRQWWARHRKRILWATVIMLGLMTLAGLVVMLGLRRDTVEKFRPRAAGRISELYQVLRRRLRFWRRDSVLVVLQQAEIVPAEPVLDQKLK